MTTIASRLDKFYYWYFLIHIPITVLIDSTIVIPPSHQLWVQRFIVSHHIETNHDILLMASPLWFKVFGLFELVVQLPIFFIGSWCLRRQDRRIWPVMMIYGFNAFFTTLVCLVFIVVEGGAYGMDTAEQVKLVAIYVPYLLIPLVMLVDYGVRLVKVLSEQPEGKEKQKTG